MSNVKDIHLIMSNVKDIHLMTSNVKADQQRRVDDVIGVTMMIGREYNFDSKKCICQFKWFLTSGCFIVSLKKNISI